MPQVKFEFEELSPRDSNGKPIEGMMLYGTATLTSTDEDHDKYLFSVTDIVLDGGFRLVPTDSQFGSLYQQIEREIYNDKTAIGRDAHDTFCDAVDGDVDTALSFRSRVYNALAMEAAR